MAELKVERLPGADERNDKVMQARDLLIDVVEDHEKVCEEPDCNFHTMLLGYLGHSIGVRETREQLHDFETALTYFNENCTHRRLC